MNGDATITVESFDEFVRYLRSILVMGTHSVKIHTECSSMSNDSDPDLAVKSVTYVYNFEPSETAQA